MQKIDTHCHIVPPGWRKWCEELGWDKPDGMPSSQYDVLNFLSLSPADMLTYPGRNGHQKAILS